MRTAETIAALPDDAFIRFLLDEVRMTQREIVVASRHRIRWRIRCRADMLPDIADLRVVVLLLVQSGTLYDEEIGRFLRTRQPDLGYVRPFVLLGRGRVLEVLRVADTLALAMMGRCEPPDSAYFPRG